MNNDDNMLHVVDVGASGGVDPKWEGSKIPVKWILFEPDPREYHRLKSTNTNNFIVLNSALSNKKRKIKLNLCKKQMVSSVYTPNFDFLELFPDKGRFEVIEKIEISADTLDNQLEINNVDEVDFIKIDTQGYELSILQGGGKYIEGSIGLEIEVEFEQIYKDQPLFSDIDNFIRKKGFTLFDLKRYYWKRRGAKGTGNQKGQLVFGDALYLRTPESILAENGITEGKVARAMHIYLTYGYIDLSQTLLHKARSDGVLSIDMFYSLNKSIDNYIKKRSFFNFLKSRRLSSLIRKIGAFLDKGLYSGTDLVVGNR
jgi:FkbM family methyltransferase